jgi:hypothetical protein
LAANNSDWNSPFVWLDEFETPPETVSAQLIDAETGEVLEEKQVSVRLLV